MAFPLETKKKGKANRKPIRILLVSYFTAVQIYVSFSSFFV